MSLLPTNRSNKQGCKRQLPATMQISSELLLSNVQHSYGQTLGVCATFKCWCCSCSPTRHMGDHMGLCNICEGYLTT